MQGGYTYILGSHSGTLYVGVTAHFDQRILAHKAGEGSVFTAKYGVIRLLYYERFLHIEEAIGREKQLKGWTRRKKLNLVRTTNPEFKDLAATLGWRMITAHERMDS